MIVESTSKKKIFLVKCANWKSAQFAADPEEAAALALEEAFDFYKESLPLSPTIWISDTTNLFKEEEPKDSHIIYTPTALANAGMHSISKKYSTVIKLMGQEKDDNKDI